MYYDVITKFWWQHVFNVSRLFVTLMIYNASTWVLYYTLNIVCIIVYDFFYPSLNYVQFTRPFLPFETLRKWQKHERLFQLYVLFPIVSEFGIYIFGCALQRKFENEHSIVHKLDVQNIVIYNRKNVEQMYIRSDCVFLYSLIFIGSIWFLPWR